MRTLTRLLIGACVVAVAVIIAGIAFIWTAPGDSAQLPEQPSIGPRPDLPAPNQTVVPTVRIAAAKGCPPARC
jgi:hypothetical protein